MRAAILLGVDVNVRGENRRTGLISAVYKNHKAVVSAFHLTSTSTSYLHL